MALTAQDAIASLNKLPLAQKIGVLVFIVGGISAANYFLLVQPEYERTFQLPQEAIRHVPRFASQQRVRCLRGGGIIPSLRI